MSIDQPIYSYSCHVVELPSKRIVHLVVFSVDMDAHRTVLYEKDYELPTVDLRPADWAAAMDQVLMEVGEAILKDMG